MIRVYTAFPLSTIRGELQFNDLKASFPSFDFTQAAKDRVNSEIRDYERSLLPPPAVVRPLPGPPAGYEGRWPPKTAAEEVNFRACVQVEALHRGWERGGLLGVATAVAQRGGTWDEIGLPLLSLGASGVAGYQAKCTPGSTGYMYFAPGKNYYGGKRGYGPPAVLLSPQQYPVSGPFTVLPGYNPPWSKAPASNPHVVFNRPNLNVGKPVPNPGPKTTFGELFPNVPDDAWFHLSTATPAEVQAGVNKGIWVKWKEIRELTPEQYRFGVVGGGGAGNDAAARTGVIRLAKPDDAKVFLKYHERGFADVPEWIPDYRSVQPKPDIVVTLPEVK